MNHRTPAAPAPTPSLLFLALIISLAFASCGARNDKPDISGISVGDIHIERFDTAFFNLDSNHISEGLHRLDHEYPYFTGDFVANFLGAGPLSDSNRVAFEA